MPDDSPVPAPVAPGGPPAGDPRREPARPATFPGRVLWIALIGVVVGNLLAGVGYALGLWAVPGTDAGAIALGQLLLWGGLLWACVRASRGYGSGSVRRDFGLHPRPVDAAIGLGGAVLDWVAAYGVNELVSLLGPSYTGSNSDIVTDVRSDVPALAVTVVIAVLGAPIVEELFFRGLLQRSIVARVGVLWAVLGQGLLFGAVHVVETTGAGRLGLWLSLSAVGVVHGLLYQRFGRLTVPMWAHLWFNALGVIAIFGSGS